ncbi:phosphatase PAP2 family protein [Paractinoplanes atraurantiacus]|nr:phosphatase PAP2 family protein [Actinoplanes atraurantiacus]
MSSTSLEKTTVARWITEVFTPGVLVAGLLLLVAWHSSDTALQAVAYGLVATAAASVLPVLYILRGVRKGKLSDKHVVVHSQRRVPLLVILLSTALGTAALALAGAPRELLALIASMVAALLVAVPVTVFARWGISLHALVAAGAVAALTVIYGPAVTPAWLLVVAVGWARVRLKEHTLAQVLAGAAVGAAATGILFPLLS